MLSHTDERVQMIPNTIKPKTIDVHELKNLRTNQPDLCIIDVREQTEWNEKHIPGALHIPKDSLTDQITSIIPDKNHPIYLHCKGGTRSLWAAERLIEKGYSNASSINGGITAWAESGYPIE